jgi:energy-coupling factor transporter ATP-binding protein EcfA2
MSMATRTDTQSPALHLADRHDLFRVHGARENNLKDVSVEIPKRWLTVFTGVSGSGKSSLVFGRIPTESQRLINEAYSAFGQGFMPILARPDFDVLEALTTAIIVDQGGWVPTPAPGSAPPPTPTRCFASSSPTRQAVRRLAQRVLFQRPLGPRGQADLDREAPREYRETRVRRRMSQ